MKRLPISIITGGILGIFCIIGVGSRVGFEGNELFLLSIWYNRVIMGLVIGLASQITILKQKEQNAILRGFLLGLIVTSASFLSTEFRDIPSFFAGIVYGIIIDFIATKYGKE